MASPIELMLSDLKAKYQAQPSSPAFSRLYEDDAFGHMFAVLHERLNNHFDAINDRARTTRHYWAENSRDLIGLIREMEADLRDLSRANVDVAFAPKYQEAIKLCEPWLSQSGGSAVPEDFDQIEVIRYEPVFSQASTTIKLHKQQASLKLSMVGEGSYAHVYSYEDPDYGIKFAIKRAKKGLSERDLYRFKQEFAVMKRLSFPYVVEVYKYDDTRNEYRMEFCDETLRSFIAKRNAKMSFASRKRVALQFLYGMNYLHAKDLLHRDISLQNVLLKVYESGAVLVKLSDFGLVKDKMSDFTRTTTEMRGTIRDPLLDNFKAYNLTNEMYSIGWVLSYIFTGKESLRPSTEEVDEIIRRCVANDPKQRYSAVFDLISAVERLATTPA
jgi:hypothetical protein